MSDFELSEEAKAEFLNLDCIKKNLIECWFDGQKLVIPSGQGKSVKGYVLCSLEAFKVQQAKIDQLDREKAELQNRIDAAITEFGMFSEYLIKNQPQGDAYISEDYLLHGKVLKALRGDIPVSEKTKYDWTNVPDHINWLATYEFGDVAWGFVNKPYRKPNSGIWHETGGEWRCRVHLPPYSGHWTESLEERPLRGEHE